MLTLTIPAAMVALAEKITLQEVLSEYSSGNKKYYILTGLAWALAIFFSLRSFQLGQVSLIVSLQATSALINVLVAYILLRERDHKVKKIIAACLVVAGVCLTVLK
jgi:uncharacterized membrane protein